MALSLTLPGGSVQLSGNPIWCKVAGAVIPSGATNYQLLLKVTSIDSVLSGGPFVDAVSPDASGEALFDISGYVDQPMPVNFEYPQVASVKAYIDAAYNIKIEFGQRYINSSGALVESYEATNQLIQILKGGISDFKIGEYNDAGTSFFAEIIQKGKYLTNQPDNMVVAPNQPVKLWMMSPYVDNTNMTMYTTGHYADGTSEMITQPFEIFLDGLFEFSMAPFFIGIPMVNLAGSPLVSFGTAVVKTGDGTFGDSRTYTIDNNYYENSNFLFDANSLGGVDVIWLKGAVEKSIDLSGTEGVRPMGSASGSRTGTIVSTSKTGRRKWKINTGYKSASEMQGMIDVYLSRNLWLLIDGKLIPVILTNSSQLLTNSMDDLHSAELELLEAHNARFA